MSLFTPPVVGQRPQRLHEPVADQIRLTIFRGLVTPGHKLPTESELAQQFQTSRLAIREALRSLEKEGLVLVKRGAGGGAFVADVENAIHALTNSLNTVVRLGSAKSSHLSEVRSLLEPEITRLATLRATPQDLRILETVVADQEQELKNGYLGRRLDMEFHHCVAVAAHNEAMSIIVDAVNQATLDPILRSRRTNDMRQRIVRSHREIFQAIRSGDDERAKQAMSSHLVEVQCHIAASMPE